MSFLGVFCLSSVLLGALYMLIPSGKMSRTVKYGFCLCFLALIVSGAAALGSINPDLKLTAYAVSVGDLSEKAARAVFSSALKAENISFTDLRVITSKNASGGIDINEVIVYSTESAEKIKKILENKEYYKVSVIGE